MYDRAQKDYNNWIVTSIIIFNSQTQVSDCGKNYGVG